MCECAGCKRMFGGVRTFDMHQRLTPGGNECIDPATLPQIVSVTRHGRQVWIRADERPHPRAIPAAS